jgi:hypothetical protein
LAQQLLFTGHLRQKLDSFLPCLARLNPLAIAL